MLFKKKSSKQFFKDETFYLFSSYFSHCNFRVREEREWAGREKQENIIKVQTVKQVCPHFHIVIINTSRLLYEFLSGISGARSVKVF